MTCIIGHRSGWMVADRRVTFGDTLIGPYKRDKIRKGCGLLVGIAGSSFAADYVGHQLAKFSGSLGDMKDAALYVLGETMREHGRGSSALVVIDSELWLYDEHGARSAIDSSFWAIGSGYQAALGWLHGRLLGGKVEPQDAQNAISFAAQLNSDVGGGWQVERL